MEDMERRTISRQLRQQERQVQRGREQMMDEGVDRIRAAYRDNYDRLVEIKNRYDPTNLFHVNQNINPNS